MKNTNRDAIDTETLADIVSVIQTELKLSLEEGDLQDILTVLEEHGYLVVQEAE